MLKHFLSLLGPVYLGYRHLPYKAVVIVALGWAAYFLWDSRAALEQSRRHAYGADSTPAAYTAFVTVLLFVSIALVFVAAHSAAYFLASRLS
jgi:hypothetical protein